MNRRNLARACAAIGLLGMIGAVPLRAQTSDETVYNALMNDQRFTVTMKMIYLAGAAQRVMNPGTHLTVFAATDTAWDNSSFEGLLASLSSNGASSEFPQNHSALEVIRGFFVRKNVTPEAVTGKEVDLTSNAGRNIEVDGKTMTVKWVAPDGETRSAKIAGQPIETQNGVIYPMDVLVGQ